MLLSESELRQLVRSLLLEDEVNQITKVGQLLAVLDAFNRGKKSKKAGKAGLKFASDVAVDLIPLPGLNAATSAAEALWKIIRNPSNKKTNSALDIMMIDKDIKDIVADDVEDEFVKHVMGELETLNPGMEIAELDMDVALSNWLKATKNSRTVTGF